MNTSSAIAAFGAAVLMCAVGCGGGNGSGSAGVGSSRGTGISGIWSGPAEVSTVSSEPSQVLKVEFMQTGSQLTGTTFLDVNGAEHIGTLTGTDVGNTISISVNYGSFGTTSSSLVVNGDTITGTSQRKLNGTVVDSGSTSLSKQVTMTTPNIGGNYSGTEQFVDGGNGTAPVALKITQTNNTLTLTGNINNKPVAGTGAIIGSNFIAQVVQNGTSNTTIISGSVNPASTTSASTVISASYSDPNSDGPLNLSTSQ